MFYKYLYKELIMYICCPNDNNCTNMAVECCYY
jgi:hypothetical protein